VTVFDPSHDPNKMSIPSINAVSIENGQVVFKGESVSASVSSAAVSVGFQ